jgi:hypothetical protein
VSGRDRSCPLLSVGPCPRHAPSGAAQKAPQTPERR